MKLRKRNSHHHPAPRAPRESVRSAVGALRAPMNEELAFYVLRRIV